MSEVEKFASNRVVVECRYNPVQKRYRCNIAVERKRHGPFFIRKADAEAAAIKALAVAVQHGMIEADDIEAEDGAPVVCALPPSTRERRAPTQADVEEVPEKKGEKKSNGNKNGEGEKKSNGNKNGEGEKKSNGNSGKKKSRAARSKKAEQLDGADQNAIKVVMPDGSIVPVITSTPDGAAPAAPPRRWSSRDRLTSQVLQLIQEQYGTAGKPPTPAEARLAEIRVTREIGPRPNPRRPERPLTEEEMRRRAFAEKIDKAKREEAARRVAIQQKERQQKEAEARAKEQVALIDQEIKALG